MRRAGILLALATLLVPGASHARQAVEVWTDRGNEAVYEPGERMQIKVRSADDAHVLVYEIDSEGYVRLLFPDIGGSGFLEGRETYGIPAEGSNVDLVVQQPVGQCYIVALASAAPFDSLPWYLRPYDAQAEAVGYVGAPLEEQGVTAEGRIVGDPFVAMERIRRRVVEHATDAEAFATAYTSYYVHQAVRYPRYVCYDCHRPGHWAWWDGFDPYYATCSVFDLRVNWSWYWGPAYWYGYVPYFVYVYRPTCPPRYHPYWEGGGWYSSWDGWSRWNNLWGGGTLRRYKSPPPPGYQPPSKFGSEERWRQGGSTAPPGYLTATVLRGRATSPFLPVGRGAEVRSEGGGGGPRAQRPEPGVRSPREYRPWSTWGRQGRPAPAMRPREESQTPQMPGRGERPAPSVQPRQERPAPQSTPREERPAPAVQAPRQERPAPPPERPRDTGRSGGARDGGAGRRERGGG